MFIYKTVKIILKGIKNSKVQIEHTRIIGCGRKKVEMRN